MRIGIDGCCWSNGRGFGRYTRELVTHLIEERGEHEFVIVVDRTTAEQCQFPEDAVLDVVNTNAQPTVAACADGSRSLGDMWKLARAAASSDYDLFFFPAVYSYYPLLRRIPTIVTFHDTIAERHPKLIFPTWRSRFFWKIKTKLALLQSNRLLTVSESAKSQIIDVFEYNPAEISVILEGPGAEFRIVNDRERLRSARQRYHLPHNDALILYVGGISPHKNLDGLLRALVQLKGHPSPAWHVALVGDYKNDSFLGCYDELVQLRHELNLSDVVTFTGFVPNEDLVSLYNEAYMLVLPSFNEGFGLPVVEAMACGLPVTASNRGSLPEVIGNAGLLFDPENSEDIANSLSRLLNDGTLHDELVRLGLEQARTFSWKSAARQAIRLFEETARGTAA